MRRFLALLCPLAGVLCLAYAAPLPADPPAASKKSPAQKAAPTRFIRIQRAADKQPIALQTATVRYVPASGDGGLEVDLVGVVHVADRAYYQKLNKQLAQYDVLLYELVAPQGTRIPKGGKRSKTNPLAMLQDVMKTVLDLESQVELIDYTSKNFVHADLSPDEMAAAIRKRGDDGLTLVLSIAADLLRQQNLQQQQEDKPGEAEAELDPLSLLLDPDAAVKLKRMMAVQFETQTSPAGGLGQTLNTILVSDRNQAAMQVFQKELAKGKKKIGIFYGAAHMPDFEKRLKEDFGLKKASEQWQTAWDLRPRKKSGLGDLLKQLGQ